MGLTATSWFIAKVGRRFIIVLYASVETTIPRGMVGAEPADPVIGGSPLWHGALPSYAICDAFPSALATMRDMAEAGIDNVI